MNDNNAMRNDEDDHVAEEDGVVPPSTTMQGVSSSKKINVARGWIEHDMLVAIGDVEFNRYFVRAASKKHGVSPTSLHMIG